MHIDFLEQFGAWLKGLAAFGAQLADQPLGLDETDAGATRNGSTPMSIKRVTAEGASLVCSVESTSCPVRLAFTFRCKVSTFSV